MTESPTVYQGAESIRLTQSRTGHIHSPMFTYDCRAEMEHGKMTYYPQSQFHEIKHAAVAAFAAALNIHELEVLVSEIPKDGEIWWRLGTVHRCELPKPIRPPLTAGLPCIDI